MSFCACAGVGGGLCFSWAGQAHSVSWAGNRLLLLLADELVGWRMPNGIISRGIGGGGGGVVDGGCPDEGDCM